MDIAERAGLGHLAHLRAPAGTASLVKRGIHDGQPRQTRLAGLRREGTSADGKRLRLAVRRAQPPPGRFRGRPCSQSAIGTTGARPRLSALSRAEPAQGIPGAFSRAMCNEAPARALAGRSLGFCSPDRIRTGVTALRGRRPRPLDDGAGMSPGVPHPRRGTPYRLSVSGANTSERDRQHQHRKYQDSPVRPAAAVTRSPFPAGTEPSGRTVVSSRPTLMSWPSAIEARSTSQVARS